MKINCSIYIAALISGLMLLGSCKDKDNLTPPPVVSMDSAAVNSPLSGNSFLKGTEITVDSGSVVKLEFTTHAEGKFEQVDYKVTGNSAFTVLDSKNNPVSTMSVPFDWVGLNTIRSGFDSEKDFKFFVNLPNVREKSYVTIQVIDKNQLKSFTTIMVNAK